MRSGPLFVVVRVLRGQSQTIPYNHPMAAKTIYVCSNCGHSEPKWHGRCPGCGEWSTFVEEAKQERKVSGFAARAEGGGAAKRAPAATRTLDEVGAEDEKRLSTGVGELDRVLGGGVVPGSLLLVGGEPGPPRV